MLHLGSGAIKSSRVAVLLPEWKREVCIFWVGKIANVPLDSRVNAALAWCVAITSEATVAQWF